MPKVADRSYRALVIPDRELELRATRAGGPGGQHVNKTSTRVELRWNVRTSGAPTESERALLLQRLGKRLDAAGWVRVVAATSRSQSRNRADAIRRLHELVERALRVPRARKATGVPRAERERRLRNKRRRGALKRERRPAWDDE
jgi:ribosome-associated protein